MFQNLAKKNINTSPILAMDWKFKLITTENRFLADKLNKLKFYRLQKFLKGFLGHNKLIKANSHFILIPIKLIWTP